MRETKVMPPERGTLFRPKDSAKLRPDDGLKEEPWVRQS